MFVVGIHMLYLLRFLQFITLSIDSRYKHMFVFNVGASADASFAFDDIYSSNARDN